MLALNNYWLLFPRLTRACSNGRISGTSYDRMGGSAVDLSSAGHKKDANKRPDKQPRSQSGIRIFGAKKHGSRERGYVRV